MKLKKVLLAGCIAAMMAFSVLALAACGEKNDEDVIRESIVAELDAIKNMDQEFVDMLIADSGSEGFADYGIDVVDFMKKYLDGFEYSIDEIAVAEEGDTATATVTLTCKSFTGFMSHVQADSTAWASSITESEAASMTEEDINTAVGSILMAAMDKVEPVKTAPISIEYVNSGEGWTAASGAEEAISMALLGN